MNAALRIVAALAALFWAAPTWAQDDVQVSASVSAERAYVGDSIDLEITVSGSAGAQPPDLTVIDGFDVEYLGDENRSMTSMSIVNGRRSQSDTLEYVFRYHLTPTRPGQLKVPPVTVTVDGKPYSTQPLWIEARPAQASSDFMLRVEPSATRVYVGQPVRLKFTWYIGGGVYGFRFSGPPSGGDYELSSPPDPRTAQAGADPRQFVEFSFLGNAAVGQQAPAMLDGRSFNTLTFEQVVVPKKPGTIHFGPVNLGFDQTVGSGGDTLFFRPQTRRMAIASDPVDLEVLDLPGAGRPADFSGLVGAYSLRASATPTSASVGDPIGLTVRIRGPEPMVGAAAPDLSVQDGFAGAFKLASEGWTEAKPSAPGERVFSTTVRARDAKVAAIPAIELPYFDPDAGEYRRASSSPIAVTIKPTTEVTAADAIVAAAPAPATGAARLPTLERLPLGEGPAGIVEGARGDDLLAVQEPDVTRWAAGPVGAALLAAPVLVFVGASLWKPARRAWGSPHRRALARAERAIRRAAAADSPADAVGAAVRGYIGRMTGRPPEALTARDCATLVSKRAPGAEEEVGVLLEECEAARYGRRIVEGPSLARRAIEVTRRLDAELRSRA